MTSKSCFLQHKTPFENAELAGKGSSVFPFKWLNFAWESFLIFFFFFPNEDHLSSPTIFTWKRKWKFKGQSLPQSHYPHHLSHWPSAKNPSLFFTELWVMASWPPLTASRDTEMSLLVWMPTQNWDEGPNHVRATSWEALASTDHWNGAGSWGRGWFNFPLLMEQNCSLGEYKWNSCHPTANCFRTSLHPVIL